MRSELKNARAPIDKEGADVMWCTLGTEPKIATYHVGWGYRKWPDSKIIKTGLACYFEGVAIG